MLKWYGNLKIGLKIISGSLAVALIAGIIGGIGIIGMAKVEASYRTAYQDTVAALESLNKISTANQRIRANLYKLLVAESQADKQAILGELSTVDAAVQEGISAYWAVLENYDASDIVEESALLHGLESDTAAYRQKRDELVKGLAMDPARRAEAYAFLNNEVAPYRIEVDKGIEGLVEYNDTYAVDLIISNDRLVKILDIIMVVCIVVGLLLAVLIGIFLARNLSRRIGKLVEVMGRLSKGNLDVDISLDSKDEIGVLSEAARDMSASLKTIIKDLSGGLGAFASGNFALATSAERYYIGDYRPLMDSMNKLRDGLSDTLRSINTAAEQVAVGSDQVSSGAQSLAAGSTEQASAVEELTASVTEVADQAEKNLITIGAASKYIEQAGVGVSASNEHMNQLSAAMAEIGTASSQIANITKVIEDIAFQTNILALNAAIEAARAGNAGKGFAVVADEVRNLAGKSAEAARQTAELIGSAVGTVERGTQLTEKTSQVLHEAGASTERVSESFAKIEQASTQQTSAIEQIKEGLNQISSVIQTNAATAEENSATSEEMSAQAATLRQEVGRFKLWEGHLYASDDVSGESGMLLSSTDFSKDALGSGMNMGKY